MRAGSRLSAPLWDRAEAADAADTLAGYRDMFAAGDGGPVYMDGNSLGRQPKATAGVLAGLLGQWGDLVVQGWQSWADLPNQVGDRIGGLVGAEEGQLVVSDSTTVNLYKLACAALGARPRRNVVVADANDFPTVRYVLEGVCAQSGARLRMVGAEAPASSTGPVLAPGSGDAGAPVCSSAVEGVSLESLSSVLDEDVALVCLSGVNFRSGAVLDMAAVNRLAHSAGALTLWDLSHAAGSVPVHLDSTGADLATGCGYKYLNGGPGAPAWLYVRRDLQAAMRQPIWGWWGQEAQFEMASRYQPVAGIGRFMTGTPAILGTVALDAGIAPLLEVGMGALWAKTAGLVAFLAEAVEELLVPLEATVASPTDAARRGGHLAVAHRYAHAASRLLVERNLVVADFRPPDVLRFAPVAIYTSYREVCAAVEATAAVLASSEVARPITARRIT